MACFVHATSRHLLYLCHFATFETLLYYVTSQHLLYTLLLRDTQYVVLLLDTYIAFYGEI